METIKIEIPKGYEIDSFDKLSGEIKFKEKPKKVTERIKSIEDILRDNGWDQERFDEWSSDMEEDERSYVLLKFLAKSLNEGWEPDWNDHSEYKYYPWFEMGGSSGFRFGVYVTWLSLSHVGSRLCFKTRELAQYAGKQFIDVYKQFMIIK